MMLVFSFVEMYVGCEDDMIYVKDSYRDKLYNSRFVVWLG